MEAVVARVSDPGGSIFLVSEVLAEVGETVAAAVLDALGSGLDRDFGVAPRLVMFDERTSHAAW